MVADAPPGEAVRTFRETLQRSGLADPTVEAVEAATEAAEAAGTAATHGGRMAASATHRVKITNVTIEHPGSLVGRTWLLPDEAMTIRVAFHADEPTDDLLFGIMIHDEEGNNIFGTNTKIADVNVPVADGDGLVTFDFEHIPLLDGTYLVTLAIQSTDEGTVYDWSDQQYQFSVMNPARTAGLVVAPDPDALRHAVRRAGRGQRVLTMARSLRSKAVRTLDDALSTHYVRQEDVARSLDELTRVLTDRFDAESEAVAVIGQRLAALDRARGTHAGRAGRAALASVTEANGSPPRGPVLVDVQATQSASHRDRGVAR